MKTIEDWITELDFAIENLKAHHRKCYYGFSLQMTQETANQIKDYFEKAGYGVVIRECPRKLWDITIDL